MRWWWGPLCTRPTLYLINILSWIFIVLAHWNNSPLVDMLLHSDTLLWFRACRHVASLWHITLIPLKQQSTGRHVASLWHITLIPLVDMSLHSDTLLRFRACKHVASLWHITLIPLKQQSTGRHVTSLWHITLIPLKQQSTGRHVTPLTHYSDSTETTVHW